MKLKCIGGPSDGKRVEVPEGYRYIRDDLTWSQIATSLEGNGAIEPHAEADGAAAQADPAAAFDEAVMRTDKTLTFADVAEAMSREDIVTQVAKMLGEPNALFDSLVEAYPPKPMTWLRRLRIAIGERLISLAQRIRGDDALFIE